MWILRREVMPLILCKLDVKYKEGMLVAEESDIDYFILCSDCAYAIDMPKRSHCIYVVYTIVHHQEVQVMHA